MSLLHVLQKNTMKRHLRKNCALSASKRGRLAAEVLENRLLLVAPVAVSDGYGVVAGGQLDVSAPGVLANDSDADGDALTAELTRGPLNGTLTLTPSGSFTYTPNAGFLGLDNFLYRAVAGGENSQTVQVDIQVIDGTPIARPDTYSVAEDTNLQISAANGVLRNDADIAGDPLTAVLANGPANGTVTLNADGSFNYQPNPNFFGSDQFTYRASDGTLQSPVTTVTISVTGVADPPSATDDTYLAFENQTFTVGPAEGVLANDNEPDGDIVTAILVSNVQQGTLSLNPNGSFSYTPPQDFNGAVTFTYRANDGTSNSNLATVTIQVTPVIIAADDTYTIGEGDVLTVGPGNGLLANDDLPTTSEVVSAVVPTGPRNGTLELSPDGSFVYTPRANFFGVETFEYVARVGGIQTLIDQIDTAYDVALDVAGNWMYFTDRGSQSIRRARLNGSEEQVLVNTGLNLPSGIALDLGAGKMYWTDLGTNKIQRANLDGTGVEDLISTGLIDPRDIVLDTTAGRMYYTDSGAGKISRADLNGLNRQDIVTVGQITPTSIALDRAAGKVYWTDRSANRIQRANLDGTGVEPVVTDALQPEGLAVDSAGGEIYWTEVGTASIRRTDINGTVSSTVAEVLVSSGLANPTGLAVDAASNRMVWTDIGTNVIQRTSLGVLSDPFDSEPATVTINVIGVNDPPVAFNDAYAVSGATSITISSAEGVLANDIDLDGEPLTATIVQGATRGTVVLSANGAFVYTPRATFNGTDSFTYRATDGSGNSQLATVTLTNRPIIRTENVSLTSGTTGPVEGFFDVFVDFASAGSIAVTGYEVQLDIFEPDSGITFTGAEVVSIAHPALLPGQTPTVPLTGEMLGVTDFVPSGSVPLTNGRGLFRANFMVDPGVEGTFHVTLDSFFTNISNTSAQPVALGGLVGGTITVGRGVATLPRVVDVLVSNESANGWTPEFLAELERLNFGVDGYSIPVGSNTQFLPVPWDNVTTVKMRFNEDVIVDQDDLAITGVNVESYDITGFQYDADTFTGTWQLLGTVGNDKLLFDLNADGEDAVRNTAGVALDGDWEDGFSVYPSGDGEPGGDFLFRLNVLPADVDGNSRTNIFDTIQVRDKQFTSIGSLNYSVFHDLDGNGVINIFDTVAASNNQFRSLPIGEPAPLPDNGAQITAVPKSAVAMGLAAGELLGSPSMPEQDAQGKVEYVDVALAERSQPLVVEDDEMVFETSSNGESELDSLFDEVLEVALSDDWEV